MVSHFRWLLYYLAHPLTDESHLLECEDRLIGRLLLLLLLLLLLMLLLMLLKQMSSLKSCNGRRGITAPHRAGVHDKL